MQPKVSIVIPVFNGEAFIAQAVGSALRQTVEAIEVLVVDNGSTDGTWAAVQAMAAEEARIRPLRALAERGAAAARNAGLAEARGEWIAVLDADDRMHPFRLERLLALAAERDAGLVADNQRVVDEAGRLLGLAWGPDDVPDSLDAADFVLGSLDGRRKMVLGYLKPLFRRSLVASAGLRYRTNVRIGEDYLFTLALLRTGARLQFCRDPLYDYVQRADSLSRHFDGGDVAALRSAVGDELASASEPRLHAALARQAGRLDVQLVHAAFVAALKRGRLHHALAAAVGHPAVIPMILWYGYESVEKRAARLGRWLRGRTLGKDDPAAAECVPMAGPRRWAKSARDGDCGAGS